MSNKALYINICAEQKGVPLFMQPWWLDAVGAGWDAAVAKKGDHIAGIWAYPVEKKMGVSLMRNPALTPYLGPHVFYPDDVKESNRDSFEYETIAELMKQLPRSKAWQLAIAPGIKQVGLFRQYKLQCQVHQTFLIGLSGSEETLLAGMKEQARRNVRQAGKELTISHSEAALADLFRFQQHTLSKKGRQQAYTLQQAERVLAACKAHDAGMLWSAKDGGKTQAIVWQVWDDECSYYFMGGQNPDAGSYKAMTLLLWHAIRESKKRGLKTFDFEGSMDEGVERFFRSFGGRKELYLVLHKNDSLLWKLKQMVRG